MTPLRIDVWSDIACPWCYIGKRRLEAALEQLDDADAITVRWHAFELDPSAPRRRDATASYAERLARKYGTSAARAQSMIDRMVDTARGDGIEMRFDIIQPGNTFDAHRLLHHAASVGAQDALKERLLRGYLCEGEPIGEPDALRRLAADVELDAVRVDAILGTDELAAEVRDDERAAAQLGVTGVPFFLLAERFAVVGAQPAETLALTIAQARARLATTDPAAAGAACSLDGC